MKECIGVFVLGILWNRVASEELLLKSTPDHLEVLSLKL